MSGITIAGYDLPALRALADDAEVFGDMDLELPADIIGGLLDLLATTDLPNAT